MTRALDGIAYREEGPADGPPALVLHGYPESSCWAELGVFLRAVA